MSFSSLYKFALKLKGRGHFLSPREVKFLKELLNHFSEDEIKSKLEKCYKELIPPMEKDRTPITKCRKLFKVKTTGVYLTETDKLPSLAEVIKRLPPEVRLKIYEELKKLKAEEGITVEGKVLEDLLRLLIRKYT